MYSNRQLPSILNNKLWHTTSLERYESIAAHGQILRDPPLGDNDRHTSRDGPQYNPIVRQLKGISLFDFTNFNPAEYEDKYPSSTWYSFVPCYHRFDKCIWIEIDRSKVQSHLLSSDQMNEIEERERLYGNRMPKIEVACLVDIKTEYFLNVLRYNKGTEVFEQYDPS